MYGRGRKTWRKRVNDDMKLLGLQPEWAVFRDMQGGFILRQTRQICFMASLNRIKKSGGIKHKDSRTLTESEVRMI